MRSILIVDDHPAVRAGLKQVILDEVEMAVADEACSADEALDKLRKTNYSVVVLDIARPAKKGFETLKEIKSEFPMVPVLILSLYSEDEYALSSLRSGASGYLTKDTAEQLAIAVLTVAEGGKYIIKPAAENLTFNFNCEERSLSASKQ
jgi:two-component system invasion response regulator UvrY